jgi:hypothetical protein
MYVLPFGEAEPIWLIKSKELVVFNVPIIPFVDLAITSSTVVFTSLLKVLISSWIVSTVI